MQEKVNSTRGTSSVPRNSSPKTTQNNQHLRVSDQLQHLETLPGQNIRID